MRALTSPCGEGFRGVAAGGAVWGGEEAGSGMNKDGDCWVFVMFVKTGSMTGSSSRAWKDFHS